MKIKKSGRCSIRRVNNLLLYLQKMCDRNFNCHLTEILISTKMNQSFSFYLTSAQILKQTGKQEGDTKVSQEGKRQRGFSNKKLRTKSNKINNFFNKKDVSRNIQYSSRVILSIISERLKRTCYQELYSFSFILGTLQNEKCIQSVRTRWKQHRDKKCWKL